MTQLLLKLLCGQAYPATFPAVSAWTPSVASVSSSRSQPDTSGSLGGTLSIVPKTTRLSHKGAEALCEQIRAARPVRTVVVDLRDVEEVTTAAFAKLVLLRRELLRSGRDLRLKGLHDRAASVWRISRLGSILPLQ